MGIRTMVDSGRLELGTDRRVTLNGEEWLLRKVVAERNGADYVLVSIELEHVELCTTCTVEGAEIENLAEVLG